MNETIDISRVFPEWQAVRRLGRGAYGSVYEIERHYLGKTEKAALKIMDIPSDYGYIENLRANSYSDNDIRERIRSDFDSLTAEYDRMKKLIHTNIVNCNDFEYEASADGMHYRIYIKMELLTPLLSYSSPYTPEQMAKRIGIDICKALELCERRQIVHRDIKPQNLFINQYGEYKLGDFGISRMMEHTTHASKAGTPGYMAPEVYYGKVYHHEVDIYSLGLVMYWLLNERRLPFLPLPPERFSVEQEWDALKRRLNGEALPPPKNGSDALKQIVLKACAYRPQERYRSAAEMRADLERLSDRAQVNTPQPSDGSYSFTKEQLRERTGSAQKLEPKPEPKPESKPEPKEPDEAVMRVMRMKLEKLDNVKVPSKPSAFGNVIFFVLSALFGYVGNESLSRFRAGGNAFDVIQMLILWGIGIFLLIACIVNIVDLIKINRCHLIQVNPDKSVTIHLPHDGCRYALAVHGKWDDAYVEDEDVCRWSKLPANVKLCRLKPAKGSYKATLVCENTIL